MGEPCPFAETQLLPVQWWLSWATMRPLVAFTLATALGHSGITTNQQDTSPGDGSKHGRGLCVRQPQPRPRRIAATVISSSGARVPSVSSLPLVE